jgi:TonB family protein
MKIRYLAFWLFLVFGTLYGNCQNSISNNNFIVTKFEKHGFYSSGRVLCYLVNVEIINNTNLKLRKTVLKSGLSNINLAFESLNNSYFDLVWLPQTKLKINILITKEINNQYIKQDTAYYNKNIIDFFDRTPKEVLFYLDISTHNIDKDYNETIFRSDILNDWKDYQKVLGLREIEPNEKLKAIIPTKEQQVQIKLAKQPIEFKPLSKDNQSFGDSKRYGESEKFKKSDTCKLISLSGRSLQESLPMPDYNGQAEGIIAIEIIVNKNGDVTEAKLIQDKSTIKDENLIYAAIEAAKKAKFKAKHDAPDNQKGTINYNFRLN